MSAVGFGSWGTNAMGDWWSFVAWIVIIVLATFAVIVVIDNLDG